VAEGGHGIGTAVATAAAAIMLPSKATLHGPGALPLSLFGTAAPLPRWVIPVTDLEHPAEPVIVRLPAEIDMANAEHVGEQLRSALTPGAAVVIADLTPTVFCDSAGARQLALAHDYARAHDAQIRFVIPDRDLLHVLTVTGLDQVLPIYPSLDAAVPAGPAPDRDTASG
jgi:anti-sigma B factor antagonist